jgi:CMP-N,N'-diacetyllegionaminic acid synthase
MKNSPMTPSDALQVLVHVPARGGSKGLPKKNLLPVAGASLVRRAVDTGRAFLEAEGLPGVVFVDTDDPAIALEGTRSGAQVPFLRPPALAADDTPTAHTVLHALDAFADIGESFRAVVLLQPTSPLRTLDDVRRTWSGYVAGGSHSAISICQAEHPLSLALQVGDAGVMSHLQPPPAATRRQANAIAFFPNGAVFIVHTAVLRETQAFVHDGRTRGVEMPRSRSVDVDDADTLWMCDVLAARLGQSQ